MRWALSKEHHDFFQQNGYIEFDSLQPLEQLHQCQQLCVQQIEHVLAETGKTLHSALFEDIYSRGRDLWQPNPQLKKWVTSPHVARLAAELLMTTPLRLGFVQWLCQKPQLVAPQSAALKHLLTQAMPLKSLSCISNTICGVMICLKAPEEPLSPPFPSVEGNAIYMSPEFTLSLKDLEKRGTGEWLLITYVVRTPLYLCLESDPNLHALKQKGYVFGDRLKEEDCPTVYRD